MHILKGMSSSVIDTSRDGGISCMSDVLAVDVIRYVLYPAYINTGHTGGLYFDACMASVTDWDDAIFANEVSAILSEFPVMEATMVGALQTMAMRTGHAYYMTDDFTSNALVYAIIKDLLLHVVNEPTVRSGKFFTDTTEASGVCGRLMCVVMDAMLSRWVVLGPCVITRETRTPSTVVSTGVQTIVASAMHTNREYVDDISPDDSVSVVNGRRSDPPQIEQLSQQGVATKSADVLMSHSQMSVPVTFDDLLRLAR